MDGQAIRARNAAGIILPGWSVEVEGKRDFWYNAFNGREQSGTERTTRREVPGMHMQKAVVEYGGYLCRRCWDSRYKVHLSHRDVIETEGRCACCKKDGRLVSGLTLGGRINMLGKW